MSAELLTQALRLAHRGIPVFPVLPSKAPACQHGFKDASRDPDAVRRLFLAAPRADRIGMPTGSATGISVIDVDPAGLTWLNFNRRYLPQTRAHGTPRGGRHLFFRHPPGLELRCSAGKLATGVDIKADLGCITIWGPGYELLDRSPLAEFPKWIRHALGRIDALAEQRRREFAEHFPSGGEINQESLVRFISRQQNGKRNAALFWAACRVGEAGGSGDALIAAAVALGLPLLEAKTTVHSGLRRGSLCG